MRKTIIFLLLLCTSICANGENIYKIFKATSGITVSNGTASPTAVSKRMEVKLGDVLHIPQQGNISIYDSQTKLIYSYTAEKEIEIRVVKIILDAKKQADKNITAVNKVIENSINERKNSGYTYGIQGATYRGESVDTNTAQVYASLCNALKSGKKGLQGKDLVLNMEGDEESFHFCAENRGKKTLYINVLRLGKKPYICFPFGFSTGTPYILIGPKQKWDAKEFVFVKDSSSEEQYILFGSEIPFDCQMLQRMFDEGGQTIGNMNGEIYLSTPVCL